MAPAADPFTAASATYVAAQRGAGRSGNPLEVTQAGRVLTGFGQSAIALAIIGLIGFAMWVML